MMGGDDLSGLSAVADVRALLEGLFAHAPVGFQIFDATGRSVAVNQAFVTLFGAAPSPEYNVLRDEQAAYSRQLDLLRRAFAGEVVRTAPIWYDPRKVEHVEGEVGRRAIACTAFPIRDERGRIVHVAFVFRDATAELAAREQAETERDQLREVVERSRRTRAQLEAIVEHGPAIIYLKDLDGRHLLMSREIERQMNVPPGYTVGRTAEELFPAEQARVMRENDRRVLETRAPVTAEEVVRLPDGEHIYYSVKFPVLDEAGEPIATGGMSVDITDRVRALERLHQSEEQLRHSQKMEAVGRLAGGVAHDFNNLLTALSGYNTLILERLKPDDPLRTYATRVAQAASRASALTQQLLSFSRKQPFSPVEVDLNQLVGGTLDMLHRLIGEDIELTCALDPGLGPVRADPAELEQVIANLVVNARDAMPRGGRLALETANVDDGGAWVRLTVRDTGSGIDPEARARLFEPFFTTKDPGKGTGLGLAMVYGIVHRSGGRIGVESQPGRGTTFEVLLPRVAPSRRPSPPEPAARAVPLERGEETILLVEDDEAVREFVRFVLEQQGFQVIEAEHGADALARAAAHPGRIDLLISDVVMPYMDGSELAERLRVVRPETRVLHISGYPGDIIERHGPLGPPNAFLPKPFSRDALLERVRSILDEKR